MLSDQSISASVYFFVGIFQEDTRRILLSALIILQKNLVQQNRKGTRGMLLFSSERICTRIGYFGERRKENNIILASGQEYMQCVSARLDLKTFTMLLVYYKTTLAFSTAPLLEERSIIIFWDFSKAEYNIGSSGIFGQVYKRFELKSLKKKPDELSNAYTTNFHLASLSLSHTFIFKRRKRRTSLNYYLCKTSLL